MSPKGTGVEPHIRALDKTLIGEGCWEYGGKIRTDDIRKCGRRMCRACNNARRNRQRTAL